jgi:hypothetical protein
MKLSDIVALDGVVIRKVPHQTVSISSYFEGDVLKENETIVLRGNKEYIQRVTINKTAGYVLTFIQGTGCTVHFNLKRDGFGSSIKKAYKNYLEKNRE